MSELCCSVSLQHFPSHSRVQMWMCDEINIAQVKRAGRRRAARPHGSLSAHIQILKFMLHKQCQCQHIILLLFLCTALSYGILEHMFCAIRSHCSHFAHENTVESSLTCVNYVLEKGGFNHGKLILFSPPAPSPLFHFHYTKSYSVKH